ncbi:exodeoxyribonuclease V subunit gamma [bacterium]|nr:exodeoxyribonuclease V subunit gamma [bacterium]
MAGFNLFSSNRQEKLLAELAKNILQKPLSNPLNKENIVVQSFGMQRWASMGLSKELGILANTRFLFPNDLMNLALETVIVDYASESVGEQDLLSWRLFSVLSDSKEQTDLEVLSNYLETGNSFKRFQLAKRLAGLFDQYCVFREEWILNWETQSGEGWQADLWRKLQERDKSRYKPHCLKLFRENIERFSEIDFPERISIFGISSLPPMYIELLHYFSRFSEIDFYFFNPSKEFWTDIRNKKEISKAKSKQKAMDNDLYLEEGNTLLASNGKLGKQFFHLLMDKDLVDGYGNGLFVEPTAPITLLEYIQKDIYNLKNPIFPTEVSPEDKSIMIHSCHSLMREVEVLYDQILDIINSNDDTTPDDIVVMSPDIEEYSAIIKAVFTADTDNGKKIPFSIADHSFRGESRTIQFFFRLLDMSKSRFTTSDVLELLESEQIRNRFGISESDLDSIQHWLESTNIRWGIDEDFREKLDTPKTYETTWKFGIDRILTGFALPLQEKGFLELNHQPDILPYDEIEGSQTFIFGRFLDFFHTLTDLVKSGPTLLNKTRTLVEWSETLKKLLNSFFETPTDLDTETEQLITTLDELRDVQNILSFENKVDLDVIYTHLQTKLDEQKSRLGFLGSGITFCSMLPMRSIPFKVIALIGMNDRSFPRIMPPLSFDLMSKENKPGDRSIKEEDKYIFLEAILSARKIFYISYIGQSIRDNSSLAPSTLVSELKYYIENGYTINGLKILGHIQTNHPLQSFNSKYYDTAKDKWFSYSSDGLRAASKLRIEKRKPLEFITQLPEPEEPYQIDATRFSKFFENPSKYIINNRLEIYLDERDEEINDQEPFEVDFLSKYLMREELLVEKLQQVDIKNTKKKFTAAGRLPLSNPGTELFKSINNEIDGFKDKVEPFIRAGQSEPLAYNFELDDVRFSGRLDRLWNHEILHFRTAKLKTKDRLRIWIEHLIYQYVTQEPTTSRLIMKSPSADKKNQFVIYTCDQIDNPDLHLKTLIRYFKEGNLSPLAFFPQTAMVYHETLLTKTENMARKSAETEWAGNGKFKKGESEDIYINLAFKHLDLFVTDFEKIGKDILFPMMNSQLLTPY